jgi:hypothetical protein
VAEFLGGLSSMAAVILSRSTGTDVCPMELSEGSAAALNFFAPATGVFTEDTIQEAAAFGELTGSAVRLAVKVGTAQGAADDMSAAMRSRTAIDLACGIIMGQNRCSQTEAMTILTKVSSHRNQKLRSVAEEMVVKVSATAPARTSIRRDRGRADLSRGQRREVRPEVRREIRRDASGSAAARGSRSVSSGRRRDR